MTLNATATPAPDQRLRAGWARRVLLHALAVAVLFGWPPLGRAGDLPEYQVKAAFLYNFALFTEWPAAVGSALNVCVQGAGPMVREIDALQDKAVGSRSMHVLHRGAGDSLRACHIVFFEPTAIGDLPHLLDQLRGVPALTVAASPGAARLGVALNMELAQNKITFEANLPAARDAGLKLSSKLLNLATTVIQ